MMGISGLVVHLILTDLNDSTILTESYLLFAASGLVAVFWVGIVRYKAKAHNIVELVTGFAVGGLSQVLALSLSQNL